MLLYKYGGLYLDSDIIILKDISEIIDKINKYDYVGFGCTGNKCTYGYGRPSNAIMAAKQQSVLMKNVLIHLINKIQTQTEYNYFDLGKLVIWDEITLLQNNSDSYIYYHYTNHFDGTRDKYGRWITNDIIFSDTPIEYEDIDNMFFLMWYNSNLTSYIKNMSRKEILNKPWNFTNYLYKSLNS